MSPLSRSAIGTAAVIVITLILGVAVPTLAHAGPAPLVDTIADAAAPVRPFDIAGQIGRGAGKPGDK